MNLLPRKILGNSLALDSDYFHNEIPVRETPSKNVSYNFDMIEYKYLIKITLFRKIRIRTVQKCAQYNNIGGVCKKLRPSKSAITEKMVEIVRST